MKRVDNEYDTCNKPLKKQKRRGHPFILPGPVRRNSGVECEFSEIPNVDVRIAESVSNPGITAYISRIVKEE